MLFSFFGFEESPGFQTEEVDCRQDPDEDYGEKDDVDCFHVFIFPNSIERNFQICALSLLTCWYINMTKSI